MTREELLKGFAEMSAEDQEAIRAELAGKGASKEAGAGCRPELMKERMMQMMKMVEGAEDPTAACERMMQMCQEMMRKMAGKSCA